MSVSTELKYEVNHIKFSISTVYCLLDFTYALLRASRQLSIMCFVFCYICICFLCYLILGYWQFLDAFLPDVNVHQCG